MKWLLVATMRSGQNFGGDLMSEAEARQKARELSQSMRFGGFVDIGDDTFVSAADVVAIYATDEDSYHGEES